MDLPSISEQADRPYTSTGHLPEPEMVQRLASEAHQRFKSKGDGHKSHAVSQGRSEFEEDTMAAIDNSSPMSVTKLPSPPFWVCVLLGLVMILAGFLVLGDVMLVTVISTMFIGWVSIFTGAFEIVHAFWTRGWGGFLWQVLLGILYVAFGVVLVGQPVASALILTYVLGLALLISGIVRIMLGITHWREAGWIMLLSGVFGVLAGLVILTGFPMTGLWVLGFLLGVDLISHGIGWLAYAWLPKVRTASST
jgi:uncharacterized membrane protein HdeD (DUF308 family)